MLRMEDPPQIADTPSASRAYVTPKVIYDDAPPIMGRQRDVADEQRRLVEELDETQRAITDMLVLEEGYGLAAAKRIAADRVNRIRRMRMDPEGQATTTGEGGFLDFLPMFRETRERVVARPSPEDPAVTEYVTMLRDPTTGRLDEMTPTDAVVEAFARRRILDPAIAEESRAVRRVERTEAARAAGSMLYRPEYEQQFQREIVEETDPTFSQVLTAVDPETGAVIETPLGATMRAIPAIVSTTLNTAVMDLLPLTFEEDPETGEPLDPTDAAYRAHKLLKDGLVFAGKTEEEARDILTGTIGGANYRPSGTAVDAFAGIPVPFQPVQRQQPSHFDPEGRRVASASGNFLMDVATNLARGRSAGDELYSFPGFREEFQETAQGMYLANPEYDAVRTDGDAQLMTYSVATAPYWMGVAGEMVYGLGPLALFKGTGRIAAQTVRAGGRAARTRAGLAAERAAADAATLARVDPGAAVVALGKEAAARGVEKAARGVEKAATVALNPVESAKRAQTIRAAQDLAEGKVGDEFDILMDRHSVRRVTGEKVAEEIITPYIIQGKLNTGQLVDAGELRQLAGSSNSAKLLLKRAGIDRLTDNTTLDSKHMRDLRNAVHEWTASAYGAQLRAIVDNDRLSEIQQARQILALTDELGIPRKITDELWELDGISKGNQVSWGRSTDELVDALLRKTGEGALPARPTSPVLQSIHELGTQIAKAGTSTKPSKLRGPLARQLSRRLGRLDLARFELDMLTDEVAAAARGAAGRAVEATLENVIPDDLVFATRSLMVPRRLLTRDVYDEVKDTVLSMPVTPVAGPVVDGLPTASFRYERPAETVDALRTALGDSAIARSKVLTDGIDRIKAGKPVTAQQYDLFTDALQTEAFRTAVGREAVEAVFAGRQVERAGIEGVGRGFETDPAQRVARRGLWNFLSEDIPTVAREGGQQVAAGVQRALKAVGRQPGVKAPRQFPPQTPAPLADAIRQVDELKGVVADNFAKDLRDLTTKLGDGQQALNIEVNKRVARSLDDALRAVNTEVRRLMDERGMAELEAFYLAGYQSRRGQDLSGLGETARKKLTAEIKQRIQNQALTDIMRTEWQSLLRQFFGGAAYDVNVHARLSDYILKPGVPINSFTLENPANYRALTTANVREVLRLIREQAPDLRNAGLRRRGYDAIFELMTGWAISQDSARAAQRVLADLRDTHPEMFTELVPTLAQAPLRQQNEATALVRARGGILRGMQRVGDRAAGRPSSFDKIASTPAYRVFTMPEYGPNAVGRAGLINLRNRGRFIDTLDQATYNFALRLDAKARQDLVQQAFQRMVGQGSASIEPTDFVSALDDPLLQSLFFTKGEVTQRIKRTISDMDNEVRVWSARNNKKVDFADKATFAQRVAQVFPDEADATFYTVLAGNRSMGAKTEDIVGGIRDGLIREAWGTFIGPALQELSNNARAMGFLPSNIEASMANAVAQAADLDPTNPAIQLLGKDFAKAVGELQNAASDGRLASNLESLRKGDLLRTAMRGGTVKERSAAAAELVMSTVLGAWSTSRTVAATGLLGAGLYVHTVYGFPIPIPAPNTRYIGMNLITAPIIALTTVGGYNAVRAMRGVGVRREGADVLAQLGSMFNRPLVNAVSEVPPETVVFTSKTGKVWTKAELDRAMRRNNILITRGSIEYNDAFLADLRRDTKVLSDALPAGKFRQFARNFDPTRTNIAQYVANATDKAFRQNMFATALQDGLPEAQAASLARAVVLDYGRVPDAIKRTMNRYVLFLSFRIANYIETLEFLARDPGTFNRALLAQRNIQQASDQFVMGPDYSKVRMVMDPTEYVFDGAAGSMLYGPVVPSLDAYKDFIGMAAFVAQAGAEDNDSAKRFFTTLGEEQLIPIASYAIEVSFEKDRKPGDPGFKVPDIWVAYAVEQGADSMWPLMKERYNIVPVTDPDRRSPGRPTFQGKEWRFGTQADMQRFKRDMTILTYTGMKRTMEDYTKLGMTYDVADFLDPKRRGLPATLGFATGAQTPIGTPSADELTSRALYEQLRAAQSAQPRE